MKSPFHPITVPVFVLLLASCDQGLAEPKLCKQIPEGGCPLDNGGTCEDPACEALYGCYDGVWKKQETCKGNATGGGGAGGGASTSSGTGGCTPVMFDHTGEAIGCMPDLQNPDCPAVAAEQCPESACLTDCVDFFLCVKDGADKAWKAVAYCDETGALILAPR